MEYLRRARLRHLVAWTWRATAARPRTAASTPLISEGADDLKAGSDYIFKTRNHTGPLLVYGISSGALRAALFAQRHPNRVRRLALDAHVWTGEGSPTLAERRKKLPEFLKTKRRPIDRAFVRSIFERDHPGTADDNVIEAFADYILKLDNSIPNGTYIDMCNNLPVVDPTKIKVPTIVMRGEYDGIAGFKDLLNFFEALPNPDKQFAVMPGIAHASLQQKNYMIALHIMHSFFTQPEPVYSTYQSERASPPVNSPRVIAGPDPAIHEEHPHADRYGSACCTTSWMPGSSPGMTPYVWQRACVPARRSRPTRRITGRCPRRAYDGRASPRAMRMLA